jgi:hypothetical protein
MTGLSSALRLCFWVTLRGQIKERLKSIFCKFVFLSGESPEACGEKPDKNEKDVGLPEQGIRKNRIREPSYSR